MLNPSVAVTLTNYKALDIKSAPYPTYTALESTAVSRLSRIAGVSPVQYKRAVMPLRMTPMDDRATIPRSNVAFEAEPTDDATSEMRGSVLVVGAGTETTVITG